MIEICGVLAVIAILASVIIPIIFNAIFDARINNAAMSINTVKTGCVDHFARFGSLAVDGSVLPPAQIQLDGTDSRSGEFDSVLLKESVLDKPFSVKIGFGYVEIVPAAGSNVSADGSNSAYDLDGAGSPNDATGTAVAQAVIVDVTLADARALNDRIDGPALGEDNGGNDFRGRVKYSRPSTGNPGTNGNFGGNGHGKAWAWGHNRSSTPNVYIYLTHR